jgi:hypothetical protein
VIELGAAAREQHWHRFVPGRVGRAFTRWPCIGLAVGAASLLTVLVAIPDIFIPDTSAGWVDVWYYVGFTLRLPESLRRYWFLYQSERIAWTLPGYVVNLVASPLAANYVVKSTFFLASVVFLFGALRQTCSLRTSVFVSALAALYSFFVHSLGAGYVDGPANTYLLMTLYLVNRALSAAGSGRAHAFLAGACYVAVLLAHFVFIAVLPILVIYVLLAHTQATRPRGRLSPLASSFVVGALATALAAAALYILWNVPSRPMAVSFQVFYAHPPNDLILPNSRRWILRAFWLVLPSAAGAWIGLALTRALRAGWSAPLRLPASYWLLFSMYGSWAALYLAKSPWIMLPFYASCLIPSTFLALGPIVMGPIDRVSSTSYRCLLGLLFSLAAISYRLSDPRFAAGAVLMALACLVAATWLRFGRRALETWRAPAFLALLVVAVAAINFATADYGIQLRNAYRHTQMANVYYEPEMQSRWNPDRAQTFKAAIEAANILAPRLAHRRYYYWYDGRDILGMFFRSVSSLFFAWSAHDLLNEEFHDFDEEDLRALEPGDGSTMRDLVILTRTADLFVPDSRLQLQWKEEFRAAGMPYFAHYFAFHALPEATSAR